MALKNSERDRYLVTPEVFNGTDLLEARLNLIAAEGLDVVSVLPYPEQPTMLLIVYRLRKERDHGR